MTPDHHLSTTTRCFGGCGGGGGGGGCLERENAGVISCSKNATEQAYQEKLISTVLYNTFVTLFFEEPLCKQLSNQTVMIHFFIFPLCRIKLHRLLLLFTLHVIGQIKYYLLTKSEVITGKSQTKALMY